MAIRGFCRWHSKLPGDGGQPKLSRRVFLASAFTPLLKGQKAEVNAFDFSLLDEGNVPAELFFIREHFPAPSVSSAGWKLSVSGAVAAPFEISYEELTVQPRKTLPVTLECAENPAGGGLVSHAEWTGVGLGALLQKANVKPEGRFVKLTGADGFSRSIPLDKATHADTLIAHLMNGDRLPVNHGFPARAVIPGWYGMDSVKWLRAVELLENEPAPSGYVRLTRSLLTGTRSAGPVRAINVKSAFSRPLDGAILGGRKFTLRGAAWAGENRVRRVEVSVDAGRSWQIAQLSGSAAPYAWVHWAREWKIPGAGPYELVVRATDDQGREQPSERPAGRVDEYENNLWQRVRVTVT
jgi:DMSO/TMAO reductase YedYZ molybdopterin-dependent catalytic subunit